MSPYDFLIAYTIAFFCGSAVGWCLTTLKTDKKIEELEGHIIKAGIALQIQKDKMNKLKPKRDAKGRFIKHG